MVSDYVEKFLPVAKLVDAIFDSIIRVSIFLPSKYYNSTKT